jgi:streptogramin lyase
MKRIAIVSLMISSLVACSSSDDAAAPTDSGALDTAVVDTGVASETGSEVASEVATDTAPPTSLTLPGDSFYPESLHAAADGTLYVGSLGTGQVVTFAPGSTTATTFLAGGDPKGVAGVFVDGGTLWLCAADLSTSPPGSEVRAYDVATKAKKASYPFSQPAFCNDFATDAAGNLFVADSFGNVWQLKKGASALAIWKSDPLLQPSTATGFGADGIVVDPSGNVWVDTFSDGRLLKIATNADGTAGALTQITVTPALKTPDGMRLLDASTLVVADGTAGTVTKIVLSGTTGTSSTIGAGGLNGPTSLVKVGSTFWVSEGQLGHLTGAIAGPPTTPFTVRAVPAP